MENSKFIPWTEIELFHNVRKSVEKFPELLDGVSKVKYRGKVKLHGTNAAIRIDSDKTVTAFSRSGIITPQNDNAGFAKWVESKKNIWESLAQELQNSEKSMIIYGEWCGPGIQKGVAVSEIPTKIFAIFGVRSFWEDTEDLFYVEPNDISVCINDYDKKDEQIFILPWYKDLIEVDWKAESELLQPVLDKINSYVSEIEACDPWVEQTFGIKGLGEGLVFYPVNKTGYKFFSDVCFKAKGEKHQTVVQKKPAQIAPDLAVNIESFVHMVVTPARLEQGTRAVNNGELEFEMKNMASFLKWINDDLVKETADELAASGLDGKLAYKACVDFARKWYLGNSKKI